MAASSCASALAFHSTTFDVVDRDGQRWLQAADIARALGYAADDAISRIYRRRADEFTEKMSLTVKLTVNGINDSLREKEVRVFSLRGAHLIAMFARTPMAKEFRRWVLDVLDREVAQQRRATGISTTQAKAARAQLETLRQQIAKVEAQIVEWELVDDTPPPSTSFLKATVKRIGRHENGDWGLYVVSGDCGFGVRVPSGVMQAGGVQAGDLIRLEYDKKKGHPITGPFTRVCLMDEARAISV